MIPLYLPVDYEKIELFAVVEFLCLHNPASSHPPTVYTVNDEIDYGRGAIVPYASALGRGNYLNLMASWEGI